MPALFSALLPPGDVVDAVAGALGDPGDGLAWEPPERWHVTLAYYGRDDSRGTRGAWLADRLAAAAPSTSGWKRPRRSPGCCG